MKNGTKNHYKNMYIGLKKFTSLSTAINYTSFVDLMKFLVSMETTLTSNSPQFYTIFCVNNSQTFLKKYLKIIFFC